MPGPDASQRQYISIATKHFARHGIQGVSLATIAKDAGVSKQALLHFFSNKNGLYAAVLKALSERMLAQVDATRADTPEAHLTSYFLQTMHDSFADPQDTQLLMQSLLHTNMSGTDDPLKPVLFRLAAILKQCRAWQSASAEDTLSAIYQIVAMIQHFALSAPALSDAMGQTTFEAVRTTYEADIRAAIEQMLR